MNINKFINISSSFFPELIKISKLREVASQIELIFHNMVIAKTEDKFLKIAKKAKKLKEYIFYYPNAIKQLNNVASLGEAIILNPNEYSLLMDKELEILFTEVSQIKNIEEQNELRKLFVLNNFNCACVSIFAVLNKDLNTKQIENQLSIQQKRLNIVIQSELNEDNDINYWYCLHWFIKGNKKNAIFFLKKMLKTQQEPLMLVDDNHMLWIKNKLPQEFLVFIKNEYEIQINTEIKKEQENEKNT